LSEVKQNRAALEDREIAIGQPRHLAEWLVREMLRLSIAKRHARDTIGQAGLFQRPAHTQIAYKTPRQSGTQSKVVRVSSAIRLLHALVQAKDG